MAYVATILRCEHKSIILSAVALPSPFPNEGPLKLPAQNRVAGGHRKDYVPAVPGGLPPATHLTLLLPSCIHRVDF
jgi:hypothetical protein